MSEKVDIYLPIIVGDYLKDTGDLSAEEHGAYFLILVRLWISGGYLPFNTSRLTRLAALDPSRWEHVWATIGRFFDVFEGRISQKRLLAELIKAKERRRRASDNGKTGAAVRWGTDPPKPDGVMATPMATPLAEPMANPMANEWQNDSSSSSSASSSASAPSSAEKRSRASARTNGKANGHPNLFDRIQALFCSKWQARYGEPYLPTAKDRSQLGRVIGELKADHESIFDRCFDAYLADKSQFVATEQRHSLAFFCASGGLNKYRTTASSRPSATRPSYIGERSKAECRAHLVGNPEYLHNCDKWCPKFGTPVEGVEIATR